MRLLGFFLKKFGLGAAVNLDEVGVSAKAELEIYVGKAA